MIAYVFSMWQLLNQAFATAGRHIKVRPICDSIHFLRKTVNVDSTRSKKEFLSLSEKVSRAHLDPRPHPITILLIPRPGYFINNWRGKVEMNRRWNVGLSHDKSPPKSFPDRRR